MAQGKPGRPRAEYPYVCGPYRVRQRWRLVIVTGRGRDGRRESYNRPFDTREAAKAWAVGFRATVKAGGRTVGAAAKAYLEQLKRNGNKDGSIATARYRLQALLDYGMSLIDLTAPRAQELYDALVDEGVAADTHRGCLISGKAFGKFIVKKKWLRANPFEDVIPVGRKAQGKEQLRIDEARTFKKHCLKEWETSRDRSAAAALITLMFGLRASEVSQLLARDVDDRGRVLRIAEHQAKTKASRRQALVPEWLRPILNELAETAGANGCLFSKESGEQADRFWILWHVKRHLRAAGLPVITAHGLRGTAATIGAVKTGGAEIMSKALGHESTAITERAYIDSDALADAKTQTLSDMLDERE